MELEELRKRLLLRSRSAEIPPLAHPAEITEIPVIRPPVQIANAAVDEVKTETRQPMNETITSNGNGAAAAVAAAANAEPISLLARTVDQLFEPTQA